MSKYEDLFQRLDKDGDGAITKAELQEGLAELALTVDASKTNSFFAKIDVNGDGQITRPEFEAFVNTHNPENAKVMEVLEGLNQVLPALKKMSAISTQSKADRNVEVNLVIKNEDVPEFDQLNTRLRLILGLDKAISEYALKGEQPENTCLYIKFKCDNGPGVADALREAVDSLKEFICAIDEDIQPIVEMLEVEVNAVEDGAVIMVNLDSHPILGPYVQMAKQSAAPVENFKPSFEVKVGSTVNVATDELIASSGYLGIHAKSKSIAEMLLNDDSTFLSQEMDKKLKEAIKKKLGIEVSMFLSLLNLKALNITLEMYEIKGDLIEMKMNLKDVVTKALAENADNPALGLVKSLEFVKSTVDVLNDNNCSEMSIGVAADTLNARVDIAANLYEILCMIFEEDD